MAPLAGAADALKQWELRQDDASRDAALEAHLPLVKRAWARLRVGLPSGTSRQLDDDLCQAGVVGLIQALDGYQGDRGASFETYATIRIRGAMLDELRRQDWLSKGSRRRLKEIQRVVRALEQRLGRSASETEISGELGISVEDLGREYTQLGPATLVFLEGLGPAEGGLPWAELVADPRAAAPDLAPLLRDLQGHLAKAITGLPDAEHRVLDLLVYDGLGHKEVALAMGLSPSRISQLYASAVIRLQSRLLPLFD